MEELKRLLEQRNQEWERFKAGNDRRIEEIEKHSVAIRTLEKQIRDLETKANSIGGFGRNDPPPAPTRLDNAAVREMLTKAMTIGTAADGGYTIPSELETNIQAVAANMGAIRRLARVVKAKSAEFEQIIATNFAGVAWRAETDSRTNTATPTLASVKPPSGGIGAVAPLSNWLLNDSGSDLAGFISQSIGTAIGIAEATAFVSGDGTAKPKGILAYTLAATADASRTWGQLEKVKSGTSGDFDADDLVDLLYKLAPQYRANASFVVNPSTAAKIRKMKASGSGDYIWTASAAEGQPGRLFGVPLYEDVNVPVVSASSASVICGDFRAGYVIADIGSPFFVVDNVTSKGNSLFYVERRIGGAVTDSNAIKVLTLEV